jgi:hypothetical protein
LIANRYGQATRPIGFEAGFFRMQEWSVEFVIKLGFGKNSLVKSPASSGIYIPQWRELFSTFVQFGETRNPEGWQEVEKVYPFCRKLLNIFRQT